MSRICSLALARDAEAAGLAQRLKPRRDVHAVAKDIVAVDDDVADIDANAEDDTLVLRHRPVARDHAALDADSAADGIDDAGELHQHAVTCGLDDAAVVPGDVGIDQFAAVRLERTQRCDLIGAHQPAVADDIGGEDRRKPSFDSAFPHEWPVLVARPT